MLGDNIDVGRRSTVDQTTFAMMLSRDGVNDGDAICVSRSQCVRQRAGIKSRTLINTSKNITGIGLKIRQHCHTVFHIRIHTTATSSHPGTATPGY